MQASCYHNARLGRIDACRLGRSVKESQGCAEYLSLSQKQSFWKIVIAKTKEEDRTLYVSAFT